MQLLKIIITFISLGGIGAGTTYALFKLSKPPGWAAFGIVVATVMAATALLIFALLDLPKAVESVDIAFDKAEEIFRRRFPTSPKPEPTVTPSLPAIAPPLPYEGPRPTTSNTNVPPLPPRASAAERAIDAAVPRPSQVETKTLTPEDVLKPPPPAFHPQASAEPEASPSELQVETNPHLPVYEGAIYKLASGKTYFLDAPLGFTVGYRADEGAFNLYRDGEFRINCSIAFRTYARVSKYSVTACSPTAVLRVAYVRPGDEISDR
jgi:hypothetical protein